MAVTRQVRPPTTDLINMTISIFFSLLVFKSVTSDTYTTMMSTCLTSNARIRNQTELEDFQTNLITLLDRLIGYTLSYYNSSVGQSPAEKAYGISLCRGDSSADSCRTCLENLSRAFFHPYLYDHCKEGFAYSNPDNCMIHYANYSFFGIPYNNAVLLIENKLEFTATNFEEYNRTLQSVLKEVINEAAFNSTNLYATREARVQPGYDEKVYALAQCTRDLDRQACSGCLNSALSQNPPYHVNNTGFECPDEGNASSKCARLVAIDGPDYNHNETVQYQYVKSSRIMLPSCQLSFDNASFYVLATSNSPPVVSTFLVATWSLLFIICMLR